MAILKKISLKILLFALIAIAVAITLVGCDSKKVAGVVVSDVDGFINALQNKANVIFVDDIEFVNDTVIQINHDVKVVGNGKKTTLKNAHFDLIGPNTVGDAITVEFENVVLDGGYHETLEIVTDKSFEDVFGSERENLRCINANWGYINLTINNCDVTGYAAIEGSVLFFDNVFRDSASTLNIENCNFYGNVTKNGTVKVFNDKLTTNISDSKFYNNTAGVAAGFVISNGKARIDDCVIENNKYFPFTDIGFEERGGGAYVGGMDIEMTDCIIRNNETKRGGALGVSSAFSGNGKIVVKDCRMENNRATDGGAVFITSLQGQPIDFINCEFYNNTASEKGSVLYTLPYAHWTKKYNGGQINLIFCSIADNVAQDKDTFKFYQADGLLGYIVLRGCIVVDDADYTSDLNAYNYIEDAQKALGSGAIQTLSIGQDESLTAVKGGDADIKVPASVYSSWHSTFDSADGDRIIGRTANSSKGLNLPIIIAVCASGVLIVLLIVFLARKGKNTNSNTSESTGENESVNHVEQTVRNNSEEIERLKELTERENEIVRLTMEGKTRDEIAKILGFSVGTIKADLMSIYKKLKLSSRTELIVKYKDLV